MEIVKIVIELVLSLVVVFLAPVLRSYLSSKVGEAEAEKISDTVETLCKSAQQLLWESTGEERLNYVMENLTKLEIEVNDEVRALIESKVYELHK